jgi:hypothetical protein
VANSSLEPCPGHAPFRDACRAPPGRAKDAEFYAGARSVSRYHWDLEMNLEVAGKFEVFLDTY